MCSVCVYLCAGNDELLAKAWNAVGAECYYRLEDYNALEGVAAVVPDNDPLLKVLLPPLD